MNGAHWFFLKMFSQFRLYPGSRSNPSARIVPYAMLIMQNALKRHVI